MKTINANYPDGFVEMHIGTPFDQVRNLCRRKRAVIVTDEHVFQFHRQKFESFPVICISAGEEHKTQAAADKLIGQMLELDMDKKSILIAAGGGVVTDIAGYAASVFKRGIPLALAPTTVLGMTDAALGGKNGVNIAAYKNMVGTTYRPSFILFDYSFLDTLPDAEFVNGFAEIIKHACIKDAEMFAALSSRSPLHYRENSAALASLIEKNILLKTAVVEADEHESQERYLLNFGHTFGHALENVLALPHGHAVSIGMVIAAKISEKICGFSSTATANLVQLLQNYNLPVSAKIDADKIFPLLQKDKKREGEHINFVLLREIGDAFVQPLTLEVLRNLFQELIC